MGFFSKKKKLGFLGKKAVKEKPKPQPAKTVKETPKESPKPIKKAAPPVVSLPKEEENGRILTAEGYRRRMLKNKKS